MQELCKEQVLDILTSINNIDDMLKIVNNTELSFPAGFPRSFLGEHRVRVFVDSYLELHTMLTIMEKSKDEISNILNLFNSLKVLKAMLYKENIPYDIKLFDLQLKMPTQSQRHCSSGISQAIETANCIKRKILV